MNIPDSVTPEPSASGPVWVSNFAKPILDVIASRPPDFQDDFGSAGSAGWKEDFCTGSMEIVDGELFFTNCRIYRSNIDWSDFALEFDIRYVEGTTPSSYFSFHFRDIGNAGHSITISINGDVRIAFADGAKGFNEVSFEGGALPANQTNHILLITKGSRFAFYLNGKPFYYTENDVYRYGRCVFYAENPGSNAQAILAMDNFKIWDISDLEIP